MSDALSPRGVVLITGGEGRLAATVAPGLDARGWTVVTLGRSALDVTDRHEVHECVRSLGAEAVINLAAWTDLEGCEREPERAELINARAVGHLRDAAGAVGAHLVHVSSDYVFDGASTRPYRETDPLDPVNEYGISKRLSEREAGQGATVLRTAWISGRFGRCLARTALEAVADRAPMPEFVTDHRGSPTSADDLVDVFDHVARHRLPGLFHVAGEGEASPYDIACHVYAAVGADPDRIRPIAAVDRLTGRSARRPTYSVLDSSLLASAGAPVPGDWHDSFADLARRIIELVR